MATWLIYLRIAKRIKEYMMEIDLSYLMLGIIAPFIDADTGDDFSINTLLDYNINIIKGKIDIDQRIISFKSKYINPPLIMYKSDKKRSFLWGYYFGLIISALWRDALHKNMKIEEFIRFANEYDLNYIISADDGIINDFDSLEISLSRFDDFDMFGLLQLRNKIVKYYSSDMDNIKTEAEMDFNGELIEKFIEKSSRVCLNVLLGKVSII